MPGDNVPEGVLVFVPVPTSDPFADAAELGAPPARTEPREYIDDTDIRFVSSSGMECLGRKAASGNVGCFGSSAMMPGDNLGVSRSSTASSSLGLLVKSPGKPGGPDAFWLYVDEVRDLIIGGAEGGGIDMLALSEWVSVVPGSAYRPFLLDAELMLEADERVWEFARVLGLGGG